MKAKREKGFTLIETIVSVAIFGLVMITAVSMFNVCYMIQKKSNEVTKNQNDKAKAMELGEVAFNADPFEIEFELGNNGSDDNLIIQSNPINPKN